MNTITNQIAELFNKVEQLGSWDASAVLGSWNYLVSSQLINTAVRYIPDAPTEESGIEEFTDYSQALRAIKTDPYISKQFDEEIQPLLGLKTMIEQAAADHTDMAIRDLADTLSFMSSRKPTREQYVAEYDARKRAGMKPKISVKDFVDAELSQALKRHHALISKGQFAIDILHNMDGCDANVQEWIVESMQDKMISKLQERFFKLELRRSNPRLKKEQRDEAEADQTLIKRILGELGAEVSELQEGEDDGLDAAKKEFTDEAGNLDDVAPRKLQVVRDGRVVSHG